MDFINDLTESKVFPSSHSLSRYNARDLFDMTLMYFCALCVIKNQFEFAPVAGRYAMLAHKSGNWDKIVFSANDLAILLHVLLGEGATADAARDKLADPEESAMLFKKLNIQGSLVQRWLKQVAAGENTNDARFMWQLEQALVVQDSNYRSVRRLVQEWTDLSSEEKALVMTRLLQYFRVKAPKSELRRFLESIARSEKLELKGVVNVEKSK